MEVTGCCCGVDKRAPDARTVVWGVIRRAVVWVTLTGRDRRAVDTWVWETEDVKFCKKRSAKLNINYFKLDVPKA